MVAKGGARPDMVDHDPRVGLLDLTADRGFDLELVAGCDAERDIVSNPAGDPASLGNTGDRRETHTGRPADDVEDRGNDSDPLHERDIRLDVGFRVRQVCHSRCVAHPLTAVITR